MLIALVVFTLLGLSTLAQADKVASIQYLEHNGSVETATQGYDVSADTPFAIASVGKTLTSVALLRLVQQGQLNLDDSVSLWLPPKVASGLGGLEGISVRHLLAMTSGLPDYYVDDYIADALADPTSVQTPVSALSYAYGEASLFEPGDKFDYSNTNYVLAGLITEAASGLSYAAVIEQEVFTPSGMQRSFVFGSKSLPHDFPTGHEEGSHERAYYEHQGFGDGGVISTADDLARFYRALFIEQTLLSPAFMDELLNDELDSQYGLGIEIDGTVRGHSGGDLGFSSDARIDIKTGSIALFFRSESDADLSWTEDVLQRVVK